MRLKEILTTREINLLRKILTEVNESDFELETVKEELNDPLLENKIINVQDRLNRIRVYVKKETDG